MKFAVIALMLFLPIVGTAAMAIHSPGFRQSYAVGDMLEAYHSTLSRLVLTIVVFILALIQILIAERVFSDEFAESITSLVTIFGVEIGAYDGIAIMMVGWTMLPLIVFAFKMGIKYWRYGSDGFTNEFWGENA